VIYNLYTVQYCMATVAIGNHPEITAAGSISKDIIASDDAVLYQWRAIIRPDSRTLIAGIQKSQVIRPICKSLGNSKSVQLCCTYIAQTHDYVIGIVRAVIEHTGVTAEDSRICGDISLIYMGFISVKSTIDFDISDQ